MKQNQGNRPFGVYVVEQGQDEKSYWTKVGVAFPHKDGDGFNIELTCVPLDGRLVIRKAKADAKVGQ